MKRLLNDLLVRLLILSKVLTFERNWFSTCPSSERNWHWITIQDGTFAHSSRAQNILGTTAALPHPMEWMRFPFRLPRTVLSLEKAEEKVPGRRYRSTFNGNLYKKEPSIRNFAIRNCFWLLQASTVDFVNDYFRRCIWELLGATMSRESWIFLRHPILEA